MHNGRNVDVFPSPTYRLNQVMCNKSVSMNTGIQGRWMQLVVFVPVFVPKTQFCFSLITAQLPLTSIDFDPSVIWHKYVTFHKYWKIIELCCDSCMSLISRYLCKILEFTWILSDFFYVYFIYSLTQTPSSGLEHSHACRHLQYPNMILQHNSELL